MKKFIALIAITLSFQTYACQEEAQFIATIQTTQFSNDTCLIQIESFRHFSESMVCPLSDMDVMQNGFRTSFGEETCKKLVGSEISGYLVKPVGSDLIYLD